MRRIDYKVPGGKLLRIDADIVENAIRDIKIHGDFFMHPEEGIEKIEDALKGERIEEAEKILNKCTKHLEMIGLSNHDLLIVLDKFIS